MVDNNPNRNKPNPRMISLNVSMDIFNRIERLCGGGRPFRNITKALRAMIDEYFRNHPQEQESDTSTATPGSSDKV